MHTYIGEEVDRCVTVEVKIFKDVEINNKN